MALFVRIARFANRMFARRRIPVCSTHEEFGIEMDTIGKELDGFHIITPKEATDARYGWWSHQIDIANAEYAARRAAEPTINSDDWEIVERDGKTENLGRKENAKFKTFLDSQFDDEPSYVL